VEEQPPPDSGFVTFDGYTIDEKEFKVNGEFDE
jgi:hypothetical protein